MKGLTEGRIVHVVLPNGYGYPGEHRPAIVVRVWRNADGTAPENGCCQLVVFLDGSNDMPGTDSNNPTMVKWMTSVLFDDAEKAPRTWHWIEQA